MEEKNENQKPQRMMQQEKHEERMVRILSKDIEGKMTAYAGLTKIKGISWNIANIICKKLKIDKNKKIGSLTEKELAQIVEFMKNPQMPKYLMNRRNDFETGKDKHIIGTDLDMQKEFDIKRLKKIKSYKGYRHTLGQPVRGQRTKSHFRTNRKKSSGVKAKKKETAPLKSAEKK